MAKIINLPSGKFQVVPSRDPGSYGPPGTPGRPPNNYGPPLDTLQEAQAKLKSVQFKSIYRQVIVAQHKVK